MNNTIIDINNYEEKINNIILSKKISFDNVSKYLIYSSDSKDDTSNLNNVIIKMPPIRLLYNYSNQSYNQINFPLNPTYSKTKKFTSLISHLEDKLQELLNKPHLEWVTGLKKIKSIKNIKLNYFKKDNVKIISNNKIVKHINDFEVGSEVEIIIYLSHLWVKNERIGINYDICQIKYTSLKTMLDINMFTETKQKTERDTPITNNTMSKTIVEKQNTPIIHVNRMIPSVSMLTETKSKLKKVNI